MIRQILLEQKRTNRLLQGLLLFGVAVGVGAVLARVFLVLAYGG
jgi:ubiquinone biosynthesis protein